MKKALWTKANDSDTMKGKMEDGSIFKEGEGF